MALLELMRDPDLTPRGYILGTVWVFVLPIVGLTAGVVLAGVWEGHPWLGAGFIAGGLAAGVAGGVFGRRLTMRRGSAACDEGKI
jgi:hypothetical protein